MQPFVNFDKRVLGSKWIVHRFDRKPKLDRKPSLADMQPTENPNNVESCKSVPQVTESE